jgi:hypothetical protein
MVNGDDLWVADAAETMAQEDKARGRKDIDGWVEADDAGLAVSCVSFG